MDTDPTSLLASYVTEQCRVILAAEPDLARADRVAGTDELAELVETVHDARVAIRRLRSTVRTFAPAFEEDERLPLVAESAWYAGELGPLRDLDVIGERLTDRLGALDPAQVIGPVTSMITDDLITQRAAQRSLIGTTLRTERYAALRAVLQRWAERPTWSEHASELDILRQVRKAKKRLKRRRKAARAAITDGSPDALHLMHQARKATKRHRYAVELAAPLIGDDAELIIAKRKAQQDELGLVQDSVVAAEYLTGVAHRYGKRSGRNAFTLGVLVAAERSEQLQAERAFAG